MDKRRTHEREGIEGEQFYIYKIDSDTGMVISKTPVRNRRNKSNYFEEGEFFTVHKRINKVLKMKKDYNNLTFRLLFELLDRVEFNNRISSFRQQELAKILESHQQNISTSLKMLVKDEVIMKSRHDYYFHPKFVKYINDGNFGGLHDGQEAEEE